MERTLFCLLVSMTLGAVLLHFGQPNRTPGLSLGTRLMGCASDNNGYRIHITLQASGASGAERGTHFFIDQDGRRYTTDSWHSQQQFGESNTLLIALQTSVNSHVVTDAQWAATHQLISDLKDPRKLHLPISEIVIDQRIVRPSARRPLLDDQFAAVYPH